MIVHETTFVEAQWEWTREQGQLVLTLYRDGWRIVRIVHDDERDAMDGVLRLGVGLDELLMDEEW